MGSNSQGFEKVCLQCRRVFHICLACDRGHWCCSVSCRREARKSSQRRASRAYRKTEQGKENSRKNQRAYRQRRQRLKKSVSHQSPLMIAMPVKVTPQTILEETHHAESSPKPQGRGMHCGVCNRVISFLTSYSGFARRRSPRGGMRRCSPQKPRPK